MLVGLICGIWDESGLDGKLTDVCVKMVMRIGQIDKLIVCFAF